ncbi:hypothetical protein BU17DRAFT_64501 [Hysterangium stoloniferum]|nr:hypothetical protein BU17DRAFT_64501 [Hysterangium stoloniferum]
MQTNFPSLMFLPTTCRAFAIPDLDVDNWAWHEDDKTLWILARPAWQSFFTKWRGASECDSLADPSSPKLSLAPLTESSSYPREFPMVILVRESYTEMFHRVWVCALTPPGLKDTGVLIIGQPGTGTYSTPLMLPKIVIVFLGKTLFLFYLLVRLLQQKQNVLFSLDGSQLFLFFHDTVYSAMAGMSPTPPTPKSSSPDVFIWSLFDISARQEPPFPLLSYHCFPVQTASPDPVRFKIWTKETKPLIAGLPLWTREELSLALQYQDGYVNFLDTLRQVYPDKDSFQPRMDPVIALDRFPGADAILQERYPMTVEDTISPSPEDALDTLLDAAIERFGYAARDVFHAMFDFRAITLEHEAALQISHQDLQQIIATLARRDSVFDPQLSHRIIVIHPIPDRPMSGDRWALNFKADWVGRSVLKKLDVVEDTIIRQKVNLFRQIPQTAALAGWYFEPLAHRQLTENSMGNFWPLITMTSNGADPPEFTSDVSSPIPDNVKFAQVTRKVVIFQSTTDLPTLFQQHEYYQPATPNFPLFDAFTVDFYSSRNSAILWVLQMTVSRSHGGSAVGYQVIRKIVAALKKQLQETLPTKKRKWKTTKADDKQTVSEPLVEVRYLLISSRAPNDPVQPTKKWRFPKGWHENCKTYDHRGDAYWLEIILTDYPSSTGLWGWSLRDGVVVGGQGYRV